MAGDQSSWQQRCPQPQDVHRTTESALAQGLEGLEKLAESVVLAFRDKQGKWGKPGSYWSYCHKCSAWLSMEEALVHSDCNGRWWAEELHEAKKAWANQLAEISERCRRGEDPHHAGILDLRRVAPAAGKKVPMLHPGKRQILTYQCRGVVQSLEVMVDVPATLLPDSKVDGQQNALKVLLFFHGNSQDFRTAPACVPGCATVSINCPKTVGGESCFWFQQGSSKDWQHHRHAKLRRCGDLLNAVGEVVNGIQDALCQLAPAEARWRVMGVSMGAHAALEYTRAFPDSVCCTAAVAGYYPDFELPGLLSAIRQIPLLLMHRQGDRCCPCTDSERIYQARRRQQQEGWNAAQKVAYTEGRFLPGKLHGPTNAECESIQQWLLSWW